MPTFDVHSFVSRRLKSQGFSRDEFDTMVAFILDDIEQQFGQRLHHKFIGIYFASTHPRLERHMQDGQLVSKIRLSSGSSKQPGWALMQLAHECVHLLYPSQRGSSVLEEGVANWYQKQWVHKCPELFPDWAKAEDRYFIGRWSSYDDAFTMVKQLIEADANIIKKLREHEPSLSRVTSRLIMKHAAGIDENIAKALAKKFVRTNMRRVSD